MDRNDDTGQQRVAELRKSTGESVPEHARGVYTSFAFIAALVSFGFIAALWIGANLASAKTVEGHEGRLSVVERSVAVILSKLDEVLYFQRELARRQGVELQPSSPIR